MAQSLQYVQWVSSWNFLATFGSMVPSEGGQVKLCSIKFRLRSIERWKRIGLIHFDDFSGGVSVLVVGVAGSLVGFELFFPICAARLLALSSRFVFFFLFTPQKVQRIA